MFTFNSLSRDDFFGVIFQFFTLQYLDKCFNIPALLYKRSNKTTATMSASEPSRDETPPFLVKLFYRTGAFHRYGTLLTYNIP